MTRRGSVLAAHAAIRGGAGPHAGRQGASMPPGTPGAMDAGVAGMGGAPQRVNQTGGWGDAYGSLGLPRPPATFTDAAFGPYSPIISVPVNEPDPWTGQSPPRREPFRPGWNLPVGEPGTEGLKLADFGTLRTLADLYSVARACITYLKSEVTSLQWEIMPTKEAAKAMRGSKSVAINFGKRQGAASKFFRKPDPNYFSWQTWITSVLEEMLVYDALSIVLRPKWGRGLGKGVLGSDLDSLCLVSGPTIRPLYDVEGATPRPPAVAYQQYLYGVPRSDWMTVITDRDIAMNGMTGAEVATYRGSQMLYLPTEPRTWTPYGQPPVERGLIPIITGLSKQGYQLDYYKEGTVPAVYISPGENMSAGQIRELQNALNALAGDPAFHHKIIVLPSGSRTDPQRPNPLADQFDEIVMMETCMAFGVQPMQVGISPRVSTTQSPGASNQMAKMAGNQQDQATQQPRLMFLMCLMDFILQDVLGQEDMRFVFAGMQEEQDEETETNLVVNQVSHALATIDEGREALGKQPYGLKESTDPGFLTATGWTPLEGAGQVQPVPGQLPGTAPGASPAEQVRQAVTGPHTPAGQPAQPPDSAGAPPKNPAGPGSGPSNIPGHAAAAAAQDAKEAATAKSATPTDPQDVEAAQQQAAAQGSSVQDAVTAVVAADVVDKLIQAYLDLFEGRSTLLAAVQAGVNLVAEGYRRLMHHASAAAARHVPGTDPLGADTLGALARLRAETQRPYLTGMAQSAVQSAQEGASPAWLPARARLYGETLTGAWNDAYAGTVKKSHPDYEIVWRLGDTEHCDLCVARADKVFTFDDLPGFPGDGGFGGSVCEGGPNCFPEYTSVTSTDVELGYTRWYDGELVTIVTAHGNTLSGTPNHPVLTCAGWRPFGRLQKGEHLIGGTLVNAGATDPHVNAVPTAIGQVVQALHGLGASTYRVAVGRDDFHGDGVGSSKVDIVRPDGHLPLHGDTASGKPVRQFVLTGADMGHTALASLRHADRFVGGSSSGDQLSTALIRRQGSASGPDDFGSPLVHDDDDPDAVQLAIVLDHVVDVKRRSWSGHLHNLQTASGWYIAEGILVHNCGCRLEYREGDQVVSTIHNTQRPESVGYYRQQLADITARREQAAAQRQAFLGALPNQSGQDGTSAQGRARSRQDLRDRIAQLANERIRANGGYHGVSVEPSDIPASMIARLLPAGGQGAAADVPLTALMDAVESMYTGKFTAADLTKSAFTALMAAAVTDALRRGGAAGRISTAPDADRRVVAELEALVRHVAKGRPVAHWAARYLGPADVAEAAALVHAGELSRADIVKAVLARRTVTLAGEVIEPSDQDEDEDELPPRRGNAAGGGGPVQLPHDAHDTFHDLSDLRPRVGKGAGPKPWHTPDPAAAPRSQVRAQLSEDFPPAALTWVDDPDVTWSGPTLVDTAQLDFGDEASWAAHHEPDKVEHFKKKIKKWQRTGRTVKPIVLVHAPGNDRDVIVDGHHRAVAGRALDALLPAFIAQVPRADGPWLETHASQRTSSDPGSTAARKSAETGMLATVHSPLGTHGLWGDELAQLPAYIQNIAHALIGDGHGESEAIEMAVGAVKRWASGGGKVTPEVRAAASAAVAEWERLKAEHSTTKSAAAAGISKRSAMISIDLPEGLIPPMPGGVDDHHITLAYLGPDVDDDHLATVIDLVRQVAAQHAPFPVSLGGVDAFAPSAASDGKRPAFVPVHNSGALQELRAPFATLHASEHIGFHPHVTLTYLDQDDPLPDPVTHTGFTADALSVHRGGTVLVRVPLTGPAAKTLVPDVVKVGPKGYIHGWIFVGAPGVGDEVQHPRHGTGTVSGVDEHGHVHVTFAGGKKRQFQAVAGTGGGKSALLRRSDVGDDEFTRHLSEGAKANRRRDYKAAAMHYHQAAAAATHPEIARELTDRADQIDYKHADVLHPHLIGSYRGSSDADLKSIDQDWAAVHARDGMPERRNVQQRLIADELARRAREDAIEYHTDRETDQPADRAIRHAEDLSGFGSRDLLKANRELNRRSLLMGMAGQNHRKASPAHQKVRDELARRGIYSSPVPVIDHEMDAERIERAEDAMDRLTKDLPPDKMAALKHVSIKPDPNGEKAVSGLYYPLQLGKHIEINTNVFNSEHGRQSMQAERTGWFSRTAHSAHLYHGASEHLPDANADDEYLHRTLDHEIGHHLDYETGLSGEDAMRKKIASHLVVKTDQVPGIMGDAHAKIQGVARIRITNKIGTYAATNRRELIAELWAQYHAAKLAGRTPPPVSQAVGDFLMQNGA
jgi:2'-5' RNA ligase superfamily